MTMRLRFIKDYSDPVKKEHSDYKKGDDAFLPRKLGVYLVRNEFAVPSVERKITENQVSAYAETRETAVVEPVVEKPLPPIEDEKSEINQCEGVMASGEPCKANAKAGSKYCWRHEQKE